MQVPQNDTFLRITVLSIWMNGSKMAKMANISGTGNMGIFAAAGHCRVMLRPSRQNRSHVQAA
jgi:hypothetical protein